MSTEVSRYAFPVRDSRLEEGSSIMRYLYMFKRETLEREPLLAFGFHPIYHNLFGLNGSEKNLEVRNHEVSS